jgi:hypothetical protein
MDTQAVNLKDQVAGLRQLTGGQAMSASAGAGYRVSVGNPPLASERFHPQAASARRRARPLAIPMPGDREPKETGDAGQSFESRIF